MQGLIIRKLATSAREFAGIRLEHAPEQCSIPTSTVATGIAEGWLTGTNPRGVVRPAGPTPDVLISSHTGQPHVFVHYDQLVFHTVEGDITYRVTHQPDKYDAADDELPVTDATYLDGHTRVDHFYGCEREG